MDYNEVEDRLFEGFSNFTVEEFIAVLFVIAKTDEYNELYDQLLQEQRKVPVQSQEPDFVTGMQKLLDSYKKGI